MLRQEIYMAVLHTRNEQIFANTNNAAHGTEIPDNARLLVSNGQVGQRLDGSIPDSPPEQVEVIFERLRIIIEAADMSFDEVIKFSVSSPTRRFSRTFRKFAWTRWEIMRRPRRCSSWDRFPVPELRLKSRLLPRRSTSLGP